MGLRFRKSFKLAPGVRFNIGSKSASVSLGPRGFTYTTGTAGSTVSANLPGPFAYSANVGSPSSGQAYARQPGDIALSAKLDEEGIPQFFSEEGLLLPSKIVKHIYELKGEVIREWLEENAARFNEESQSIVDIHLDSPEPRVVDTMPPNPFPLERPPEPAEEVLREPAPLEPIPPKIGFIGRLIPGREAKLLARYEDELQRHRERQSQWEKARHCFEAAKESGKQEYAARLAEWESLRNAHYASEAARIARHQKALEDDPSYMTMVLEHCLGTLTWPRETIVCAELTSAKVLWLDVDLPEIEDFPLRQATVSSNGKRLHYKYKSESQLRREYARHVHGIAFRLASYSFTILPRLDVVVLSGFTQRLSSRTGYVDDEYLYSVRITREGLFSLNYDALEKVDPVESLELFDLRRAMSTGGSFKPIQPFKPRSESDLDVENMELD